MLGDMPGRIFTDVSQEMFSGWDWKCTNGFIQEVIFTELSISQLAFVVVVSTMVGGAIGLFMAAVCAAAGRGDE